ncbi:hypothetical protein CMQ_4432 [Grosmannia clavigera kw1407]|uniref:Uncharacterized protein n=1 Tax=Grosmannia clavigera (strain kw1407 / UAMH 11150) TaxID=655863 RepID=F0XUB1_GROCL|nr:uncharacterized protein CMQ_4432 [Grosmannia clavigera kw1407]EFW98580.1 hypothetical protein CMQ_4432 [Grosmannia clavigera kw1407]
MDFLLGRSKPAVAPVAGDRVVPLHFFEDSPLVQGNNMAVSLTFDGSAEAASCAREPGAAAGLGEAAGKTEWHSPAIFGDDRPAINFAHVDHDVTIAAYAAASNIRLPQPSSVPAVVSDPDDFADLAWAPGYQPGGITDYLGTDGID